MRCFEPALEDRLHELISREPYAADDRRLARVYLALANLMRSRMNVEQAACLEELNVQTVRDAAALRDLTSRMAHRATEQISQDGAFVYRLLECCAKPAFTIRPDNDVEPIAWVLDLGVPFDDVFAALAREYPELRLPP